MHEIIVNGRVMKGSVRKIIFGSVLIVLGIVFLLKNTGLITVDIQGLWPWLMIVPGAVFMGVGLWDERQYRQLFVGAILLGYGLLFFGEHTMQWWDTSRVWPLFVLVPGVGFLMMYFLGPRRRDHLRKGIFLSLLAGAFFVLKDRPELFWPLILIGIGGMMVLQGIQQRNSLGTTSDPLLDPPER